MQYSGDRWVQRLRDGESPRVRPLAIGVATLFVAGALIVVAEVLNPGTVSHVASQRRGLLIIVVLPLGLLVAGPFLGIVSWLRTRQDRQTLARIQAASQPSFYLPVATTPLYQTDALPNARPVVWTVDAVGLHAWEPTADHAVVDLPWPRITSFDLATTYQRGMRRSYGIRIATDRGPFVVQPRTALGRPYEAGETKLEILMRVLRSLRRELEVVERPRESGTA